MSDSDNYSYTDAAISATVTGEITVAASILIFMLFTVVLILYLRVKGFSGTMGSSVPRSRHLVFVQNRPDIIKQALDPSILKSLPATIFKSEDFKEEGGIVCAVCLSELIDGEEARFLPKCNHGFHTECIDMWFLSNSTCPLCRNLVRVEIPVSETGNSSESHVSARSFDEGSSSSGGLFSEKRQRGVLVIDIPRRGIEGFSSSASRTPVEGIKSPALERLRSLRRILSRGNLNINNFVSNSSSPGGTDIEQGGIQKSLPVSESAGSL